MALCRSEGAAYPDRQARVTTTIYDHPPKARDLAWIWEERHETVGKIPVVWGARLGAGRGRRHRSGAGAGLPGAAGAFGRRLSGRRLGRHFGAAGRPIYVGAAPPAVSYP